MREFQNEQREFSRECLLNALLVLMEKQEFSKITITELCKKAGVTRLTFYRHFESKEDVLQDYFYKIFQIFFQECVVNSNYSFIETLSRCFDYWQENRQYIILLEKHGIVNLIYQPFESCLSRMLQYSDGFMDNAYFVQKFMEGGLLLVLLEWIKDSKGMTSHEIAIMLMRILQK